MFELVLDESLGKKGKEDEKFLMMKYEIVDEWMKVNAVCECSSGGWQW